MNTELLPCPFCGNDNFDEHNLGGVHLQKTRHKMFMQVYEVWQVTCHKCYAKAGCGCIGYNAVTDSTVSDEQARQIAIDKWNRRA